MASIFKRNNKLWISYYINGKEFREPLNIKSNKVGWIEAKKIKKIKEGELAQGNYQQKIRTQKDNTLKAAFQDFINTKQNKSPITIINYETAYKKFLQFYGDKRINNINHNLVEKFEYHIKTTPYLNKKILSETSIATYFRALRIMFKYFVEKNFIKNNPFPNKKVPEKEIITIPQDELNEILERLAAQNYEHYKTIMFFLLTGLRAGELTRLTYEDIDLKKNILTIKNTKGLRVDYFPLYPKLKDFILMNFEMGEGKIFNYKNNSSLKFWPRFLKREGFSHYSIHTLRKTFISILANDGVSIFDVSKLARHKDIRTTLKSYASVELDRLGSCINESAKIHTLIHTIRKNTLKLVK